MKGITLESGAIEQKRWVSWGALLIGLLAFWAWAGAYTLAPGHIGWVMAGWDLPQHYLGWQFFRAAPWQWPIGANLTFGSDAPGSIVMSDSIPLLAIPLKAISPLLAPNFQYLGIWVCCCFLLQAWFARKLMSRITDDVTVQLAGACFFVTATIFLIRVYLHPALAGQWLLLVAFYLALDPRVRARAWATLLALAVVIHAYLFIMVACVWVADRARRWMCGDIALRTVVLQGAVTTIIVTLLMWVVGYFMPGAPLSSSMHSHFDLVEPLWTGVRSFAEWSWFLPARDMDILAYDGFCYLGLGFIALLIAAVAGRISWRNTWRIEAKKVAPAAWLALVSAAGFLLITAIGNHVYFAQKLLFTYSIPTWLDHLYGIFRGAARMMWPAWYLLLLAVLYGLLRRIPLRYARVIVVVALFVQLCDLSKAAVDTRRSISRSPPWHTVLAAPLWASLPSEIKHIGYIKPKYVAAGMILFVLNYKIVASYAATHGMSINLAYLARTDDARLAKMNAARVDRMMRGQWEPATLYVVDDDPVWEKLSCLPHPGRWLGTVNGLRIVAPDTFADLRSRPQATCLPAAKP